MGLGFSIRNLGKDFHETSKVDASLTVLLLNACSLLKRLHELTTVVISSPIKVITERWLDDKIPEAEIAISDNQLSCNYRKGIGGGALLFIRSPLRPKQIQLEHDGTPFTDVVTSTLGISKTTLNC